jgi:superfamily II DNA helicase RecQ
MTEDEDDRFEKLRSWRRIEAQRAKMPPYVIALDSTLRALARVHPKTLVELARVPGMGPRRVESHGEALLALLNESGEPAGDPAG